MYDNAAVERFRHTAAVNHLILPLFRILVQ
jgi:hypothetical protein